VKDVLIELLGGSSGGHLGVNRISFGNGTTGSRQKAILRDGADVMCVYCRSMSVPWLYNECREL
jgi:hypothetical protein